MLNLFGKSTEWCVLSLFTSRPIPALCQCMCVCHEVIVSWNLCDCDGNQQHGGLPTPLRKFDFRDTGSPRLCTPDRTLFHQHFSLVHNILSRFPVTKQKIPLKRYSYWTIHCHSAMFFFVKNLWNLNWSNYREKNVRCFAKFQCKQKWNGRVCLSIKCLILTGCYKKEEKKRME